MNRFIKNTLFFLLITGTILFAYGWFCDWFFRLERYLPDYSKRSWIMKQRNTKYSYAVLGSSRAEGAFEMKLLDSLLGMRGINLGAAGSGYVDNYLLLYKFLLNNNRIEYLFLQSDIYSLDPEHSFSNAFHVYNFLPYWSDTEIKKALSFYISPFETQLYTYFPYLRFYKYNKYYSPIEVYRRIKSSSKAKGANNNKSESINSTIINPEIDAQTTTQLNLIKINRTDFIYLHKIIQLGYKKNIKIICFNAPDLITQEHRISNYHTCDSLLSKAISNYSIPFIKSASYIRNNSNYFSNPTHINLDGRIRYTEHFSACFQNLNKK